MSNSIWNERELDSDRPRAICTGCNKHPEEIDEYAPAFTGLDIEPEDYVWEEEGTLNSHNGHFLCTECYIKAGMPSGPNGWIAP